MVRTDDYIYYTVQPGDTLQNLSVRYSCPVASIKRLNNLWSDQDFYGLARIKLPVGKFRLIADLVDPPSLQVAQPITESFEPRWNFQEDDINHTSTSTFLANLGDDNVNYQHVNGWIVGGNNGQNTIFTDFDKNIEKARTAAQNYNEHATAIMQTLAQNGDVVNEDDPHRRARRGAETLINDMFDYGLSYNGLILFIFIVCLIFPLAYVIYLEETHHDLTNKPH